MKFSNCLETFESEIENEVKIAASGERNFNKHNFKIVISSNKMFHSSNLKNRLKTISCDFNRKEKIQIYSIMINERLLNSFTKILKT